MARVARRTLSQHAFVSAGSLPMTRSACVHAALVAALLAMPCAPLASAPRDDAPRPIDFDRDVKPIFAKHCVTCHGPVKPKNGLRLDRKAEAGSVIVPGKSAESLL